MFNYTPDVAPCDFWLFPKLRGCGYETIEDGVRGKLSIFIVVFGLLSLCSFPPTLDDAVKYCWHTLD